MQTSSPNKFRLVTRSDFDGLVCAMQLTELDLIDDILFVHPKDMQDGKVEITNRDITTNLPYVSSAHLAFDHHQSETVRNFDRRPNHIIDPNAPSAARVVYNYYGGPSSFPRITEEMMLAVDKADSAQFTIQDVLNARGWELLSFLMDARTGLGRFRNFRISNYQLMMELIAFCKDHTIEEILALPDVRERVELYEEHASAFRAQIQRCSQVFGKLVVLDLRGEDIIYAGNRFMVYALYPETNISIHVLWGKGQQNTVFAIGKSIFRRDSRVNIGELALRFGGGGHLNAGTCQVSHDDSSRVLGELITAIAVADGAAQS